MLLTQQCILFRDWNTLLKYFSWSHFCHFLFVLFQAVKVDVRVSRNNFSRGLEMLEMLENVQNLKNTPFFQHFQAEGKGAKNFGDPQIGVLPLPKKSELGLIRDLQKLGSCELRLRLYISSGGSFKQLCSGIFLISQQTPFLCHY